MQVKFHGELTLEWEFLTGDINWRDYGGKWISPKLNNGDWDYWLVIEINNVEDLGWESDCTHIVGLYAVSPEAAGKEHVLDALGCCGLDQVDECLDKDRNIVIEKLDDPVIVDSLHTYGVNALLWSSEGNDPDQLLQDAKEQGEGAACLFGFYMDGPKNQLGHTGWDFIKGDLSIDTAMANLERWEMS